MKKYIAFLLMMTLIVAFCGCSGTTTTIQNETAEAQPVSEPADAVEETAHAEEVQPAEAEAEAAEKTGAAEAETEAETEVRLCWEADDTRFTILDELEPVLAALGEPLTTYEFDSCAYEGKDYYYCYDGFTIQGNEIDGVKKITAIQVDDDTVKNPQGVYIGMDMDEALELMGDDYTADGSVYSYVEGGTMLRMQEGSDGCVKAIQYQEPTVQ